jgi:hypothetical protein
LQQPIETTEPCGERENLQQPQEKQEGGRGQRQDLNYHSFIHSLPTSSSRPAVATTTNTAMGKDISESVARTTIPPQPPTPLFNLHEYFQPVFDEVDNLNKMLDSHIEEENNRGKKRKRKRNDHRYQGGR